jgi:hypothetical protein
MMKVCSKCRQSKSFECFSADNGRKANKDGLRSQCKKCRSEQNSIWHENNKLRSLENSREWKKKNPDKVKLYSKYWISKNPEKHAENNKSWKKNNKSANCAIAARYRFSKIRATPSWLSPIHLAQIQEFYDIAAARTVQSGVEYHVDHIYPLQGNGYNGLHVPWNLQIITAKENIAKKNKNPEVCI